MCRSTKLSVGPSSAASRIIPGNRTAKEALEQCDPLTQSSTFEPLLRSPSDPLIVGFAMGNSQILRQEVSVNHIRKLQRRAGSRP
ncbi:hypothetical protein SKAU_G00384350 [Synaphobranchus kaupii]|uniref:Uncharacterized protein n=1 Tax=Synaphobranchus kaupii TaxID=118154 RepID=A0A9Q1IE54_SYNKA|nr:hypothetical protein SKAU_G00384350 [Synaphobranchus kaupii]